MIYLDHAAATPLSKKARVAMEPYFSEQFFNPSSPYLPATHIRQNYEFAKDQIAHTIGAKGQDLIITSGATEATNLAFTAYDALLYEECARDRSNEDDDEDDEPTYNGFGMPEILVLETEHASVKAAAKATRMHYVEVKVDKTGRIDLKDFKHKLSQDTIVVSVSLVNNELGVVQPLAEIAEIIREERMRRSSGTPAKRRLSGADLLGLSGLGYDPYLDPDEEYEVEEYSMDGYNFKPFPLYFHTDASQALNCLDVNVARLGVDMMTISSAKIGGPKGVGALYISHDVKLRPLIHGGGQELGLRSGTENVPGVIGFAAAAEEAKAHLNGNRKKYETFAKILREELAKCRLKPLFLGSKKHQLASFVPVSFPGIDAERLIYKLEEKGVYVSTGAACAANKGAKSHVLTAIGLSDAEIAGSLRLSLGVLNTEENVRKAGQLIVKAVEEEIERIGCEG